MRNLLQNKDEKDANWLLNLEKIEDSTRKNYFSVLPQERKLLESFSDAFVINKPKGRVGGDGFWLHVRDDDTYLAVFTCVGEGHLASMMIRIYMNALKKMVDEYSIEYTGSILQFLHREVQSRFKDKNNILLNTNANVGIVKLNRNTNEMEFAGANMDLIRSDDQGTHVIVGEKHQVGQKSETRHSYTSISLRNTYNSSFYLCSSGVFNLLGGPNTKKLSIKKLGEFLTERRNAAMKDQKLLADQYLSTWTGANRQNDDIMVIGFKSSVI